VKTNPFFFLRVFGKVQEVANKRKSNTKPLPVKRRLKDD